MNTNMVSVIDSDSIGFGGLNTARTNNTRQGGETEQLSERKSTQGWTTGNAFNSVEMRTTAGSVAAGDPLDSHR